MVLTASLPSGLIQMHLFNKNKCINRKAHTKLINRTEKRGFLLCFISDKSYLCKKFTIKKAIMQTQEVIISRNLEASLQEAIQKCTYDKLFVLTDETTHKQCLPVIKGLPELQQAEVITIGPTDEHKTLESLSDVWLALSSKGGTRHSLMINLGGGMITDLGGFAASTFKRGIQYINIPTTLLAMVDASVGGKTGINFNGLKNEIGVFSPAKSVLLDTTFLKTLDYQNICSGYAEMLKHGLISNEEHWGELLRFDLNNIDYTHLQDMVAKSVAIKEKVVEEDPYEQNIRKALNLGHTAGHAIESLALAENRTVLHGYAVAWGLVCELYLSCQRTGFPTEKLHQTIDFIKNYYGVFAFDCKKYEQLYSFMTHDKKNTAGVVNFTLLGNVGDIHINQTADKQEIFNMLDFYREAMGC